MIVLCSGAFDPIHIGHLALLSDAAKLGRVFVALNSDEWLQRKKGYAFVSWAERCEILEAIKYVQAVVPVDDADGTVCEAIARIKPHFFANGGDRDHADEQEHALCVKLGVKELFGVGGGKIQSSTGLLRRILDYHSHALPR
jgi:cytidyltransferase-like protein